MADLIRAQLIGSKELQRRLKKMNPEQNRKIMRPALTESGLLVARNAATKQIVRQGTGPVRKDKLTSRTGRLRGSLASNRAIDLDGQLRFIDVGTDVFYGAIHEATQRAFLKPALRAVQGRFESIVVKFWRRFGEVG